MGYVRLASNMWCSREKKKGELPRREHCLVLRLIAHTCSSSNWVFTRKMKKFGSADEHDIISPSDDFCIKRNIAQGHQRYAANYFIILPLVARICEDPGISLSGRIGKMYLRLSSQLFRVNPKSMSMRPLRDSITGIEEGAFWSWHYGRISYTGESSHTVSHNISLSFIGAATPPKTHSVLCG